MAFARVNGVVIHYDLRGPAKKPAVVFSNSLGTDFRIWDAVAERLERDFRLVFYDKRGHGLSEATPQPYAMTDHVGNLAGLIDYLDLDWEDGVLSREESQKSVKTLSAWQVRQPVYSSSMGKWRRFEQKVGPLIEALGDSISRYEDELKGLEKSG